MLKVGDTVVYVPTHAKGLLTHPDSQFGFVTGFTQNGEAAFCRYFHNGVIYAAESNLNTLDGIYNALRTKANSEATPINMLVKVNDVLDEEVVAQTLVVLGYAEERN